MGYVIVGIAAFLLGISLTLLCLHLRETRHSDFKEEKNSDLPEKNNMADKSLSENK